MADINELDQLSSKLELLINKQNEFSREIHNLKLEINLLRLKAIENNKTVEEVIAPPKVLKQEPIEPVVQTKMAEEKEQEARVEDPFWTVPDSNKQPVFKSNAESFIGANLFNKVGILITVIGVAIGAKYAIDHELISPLARILFGYLIGGGLLAFAYKLKPKYENFSAVLLSGAMAILYFITFSAYAFYHLFPQLVAFLLMVAFTVFTVLAAITYNRSIIAHLGLVGAYAVPFLLSDGSGNYLILFSYMVIINLGILTLSIKKYWKSLYFVAFIFTWLIFDSWYLLEFRIDKHFNLALGFAFVFFIIFYLTAVSYKLIHKESFGATDVIMILMNSFLFYGLGCMIIDDQPKGSQFLGLFTLTNAVIHFIFSRIVYKQKLVDKHLLNLLLGLVLVFVTITVPVQLDGNWVTFLWISEAVLLFYIGRVRQSEVYEILSYPLMLLAVVSIFDDWGTGYSATEFGPKTAGVMPILNVYFLGSLMLIAAFSLILKWHLKPVENPNSKVLAFFRSISNVLLPLSLIFAVYFSVFLEINNYWDRSISASSILIETEEQSIGHYNYSLLEFKRINILLFNLIFLTVLAFINMKRIKNTLLASFNLFFLLLSLFIFLVLGLLSLSELRDIYQNPEPYKYYHIGSIHLIIRYLCFAVVGISIWAMQRYKRSGLIKTKLEKTMAYVLHITVLWISTSELIHWLDLAGVKSLYKLGLSIYWGLYSLFLIALGIWKRKQALRVGAMVLFAITLLKLFFYDISNLDTISKTVIFVSLGILLLISSFLYNKYKNLIFNETEN